LHDKLAPVGAALLLEVLDGIEAGTLEAAPQDDELATHAPMLHKQDGAVDWSLPASAVRDRVRGVDPWPGAYTNLGGKPLKLFAPAVCDGDGEPGEILGVDDAGLRVACGDGACCFGEVQAPGKRRMPAAAFASGRSSLAGTILGP
jgi:methionyl-tRNA formyltransferase